jgi:hypothetical protein
VALGVLAFGALVFGALAFDALVFGAPGDSGSGRGLPTCGVVCARDPCVPGGVFAGGGTGLAAARGDARSGVPRSGAPCWDRGARPGPNTKTWPTEMRKSAPMLFHRAKSR